MGRQGLASVSVSVRHGSGGNPVPENTQAAVRGRNSKIKTVGGGCRPSLVGARAFSRLRESREAGNGGFGFGGRRWLYLQ